MGRPVYITKASGILHCECCGSVATNGWKDDHGKLHARCDACKDLEVRPCSK